MESALRSTLRTWGKWLYLAGAAALSLIAGLVYWGGRQSARKLGKQAGQIEGMRGLLREAKETGDDEAVLREWRRSRK